MKLGLPAIALLSLTACSTAEDARSIETVAPEDWNATLALVPDGDDVYDAQITRLVHFAADGAQRTVAGLSYASCFEPTNERWAPTVIDGGYPSILVHRGRAFLADPFCGLWSIDLATGERTTLLSDPFGDDALWGGKPHLTWHATAPIAFAPLGDDLAVCLSLDLGLARIRGETDELDHIELWRVGLDGTPKEKLAAFEPRDERCTHVLADGATLFVATDHALYRWESATKATTVLMTDAGASFGFGYGLDGLTQDADHLYFLRTSAIERIGKDGSLRTVLLRRPADLEPARFVTATDGAFVYWVEDHDLYRIPVDGGDTEKLVDGSEDDGVFPSSLALTSKHVWYQRARRVPSHSIVDEETGIELDDVTLAFAVERVAK